MTLQEMRSVTERPMNPIAGLKWQHQLLHRGIEANKNFESALQMIEGLKTLLHCSQLSSRQAGRGGAEKTAGQRGDEFNQQTIRRTRCRSNPSSGPIREKLS